MAPNWVILLKRYCFFSRLHIIHTFGRSTIEWDHKKGNERNNVQMARKATGIRENDENNRPMQWSNKYWVSDGAYRVLRVKKKISRMFDDDQNRIGIVALMMCGGGGDGVRAGEGPTTPSFFVIRRHFMHILANRNRSSSNVCVRKSFRLVRQ